MIEHLKAVIAESLGLELAEVHPESSFVSLGAGSLDRMQLMMEVEEAFGIEIPEDDMSKLVTVADVAAYIGAR